MISFLFCKADITSVKAIKDVFKEFFLSSGLSANWEKSFVYLVGIFKGLKREILNTLEKVEGKFPFRYFGAPLHSQKLNIIECNIFF